MLVLFFKKELRVPFGGYTTLVLVVFFYRHVLRKQYALKCSLIHKYTLLVLFIIYLEFIFVVLYPALESSLL